MIATRIVYLLMALFLMSSFTAFSQDTVPVSKERLKELEKKESEVERLTRELEKAKADLQKIKTEKGAPAYTTPAMKKAVENSPAPRPLAAVPALKNDEIIPMSELLQHFASNPPEADARYKHQKFVVRGVITDLDKPLMIYSYKIIFRMPDTDIRGVVNMFPEDKFSKVYVTSDKDRVVGESDRIAPYTLSKTGQEVVLRVKCDGLKGKSINMDCLEILR